LPRAADLAWILGFHEERRVQKDWKVRWQNRWFQLTAANRGLSLVGRHVTVCEQLDGRTRLRYRDRELAFQEIAPPAGPSRPPGQPASRSHQGQRPAADHPWRKRLLKRKKAHLGSPYHHN